MADRDVEGLLRWSLACMALASAVIHASAAADQPGDDTDQAGRLIEAVRRLSEPD